MGSPLQVDIFVSPAIPAQTGMPEENQRMWSPTSITLIQGRTSAALIDTPTTIKETEDLVEWVKKTLGKKELKYIYTTHAHPDHFAGVPIVRKAYPGVQFIATKNVVDGIKELYATAYEQIWPAIFPNQIHPEKPVPDTLPSSNQFFVDGELFQAVPVGHTDNAHSSFLHVPSVDLIVSGDIVYGECYQHCGEASTPAKRREWLDALDRIEALKPKIVVAGHKRASQADGPYLISATREYLHTFERELAKATSPEALYARMIELYPTRWNLFILMHGCMESFKNRESKL